MPPTPSRTQKRADQTGGFLDEVAVMFGGPKLLKDPTYVAMKRRLLSVVLRDGEPNVIDGYKSRHGDASGGGGNSELTPVERPAFRLAEGGQPADRVHASATLIEANARRIRDGVVHMDNAARLVPGEPGVLTEAARLCSNCRQEPGDRETDVNGALPGARFLGLWCIQFVDSQAGAPAYGGRRPRLPNDVEITAWQSGKRPKVHVDPKATPFQWRDGSTTGATLNPPPSAA